MRGWVAVGGGGWVVVAQDIFAKFNIRALDQAKPYRFKAHAMSDAHVDAVMRLINPTQSGDGLSTTKVAPMASQFTTLLGWVRKGGSLRDGIPSVGTYKKVRRMLFTLAEGLKRVYRKWLGTAATINLLRDERHSRLFVRFRCSDLKGVRRIGVLGQSRIVGSTATNITITTKDIIAKFCQQNYGAPDVDLPEADPDTEDLPELYHHIRTSIHSLTVDSAGNEVAAGENMMHASSVTAHVNDEDGIQEAWAPHMKTIIRDKAHASRRILQRPWLCDAYLAAVAKSLILDAGSVAQLIQNSDDLRAWYQAASETSGSRFLSSTFSNMRAAKHRFESMCTPLSRICLDWEVVRA